MKRKVASTVLAVTLSMGMILAACGTKAPVDTPSATKPAVTSNTGTDAPAKDTITALLPPVSANFQSNFDAMEKKFNELYPHLTLKIEPASWEDMAQKLDTQVNAGSPPDLAFIGADVVAKYAQLGMLMDIKDIVTLEMVEDFDEVPLEYMKNGDGLYGFPAYMSVQSIGGNKQVMEAAGIDWKKVQQEGWTYEQFREAIKKGVVQENGKTTRYGFVFATAGVTSKDYLTILVKNAGLPSPFTEDHKYAYTSSNFLDVLKAIREMIDDGSMPRELSSIDAGKRWNMFLTGQTMITGKGMTTFENSANINNKKIDANDGSAVQDSIKVDYVVLPLPSFGGHKAVSHTAVDGYVTFRGKKEPTDEHKANVVKAAYFLASGEIAATVNHESFLADITDSGRKAAESMESIQNADNFAALEHLLKQAAPARPDTPIELGAKAIKVETEVIIPKLQALLANEITPEDMFESVKKAAAETFGADGIVQE
ncbi:ABC transporter substrate-binding protein [Paenibacillus sp. NPDC057967]|uniref:ABC transporter substrate-binding protein n=1 Tax=Paenibacillus sp. NPDC057967 TaxID=3346293 RepID=UPI0036DE8EBF